MQLMACAALVLAGKCNDELRNTSKLVIEVMKQYFGRQNPDLQKLASDDYRNDLILRVAEAEQALMFTLKFDFNVDPLIVVALHKIKEIECLASVFRQARFQQFLVSTANDVVRRDAGIILQYRGEDIGLAICQLFFKIDKQNGEKAIAEPPPNSETGAAWYVEHGLTEDIHRQISARFYKLYTNVQRNEAESADVSGADGGGKSTTTGIAVGGGATGGGGAMRNAAVSGGGGGGAGVTPGLSSPSTEVGRVHSALESTADKPKISHGGGGGGGGRRMITMGPRGSAPSNNKAVVPSVVPPIAAAGISTSSSQQHQQHQQYPPPRPGHQTTSLYPSNYAAQQGQRPFLAQGGAAVAAAAVRGPLPLPLPPSFAAHAPLPPPPSVHAAAAAAQEDSDLEEGEIEEGEIV